MKQSQGKARLLGHIKSEKDGVYSRKKAYANQEESLFKA
jgi:hypothetical protein